jgi:magnesium transporter
VNAVSRDARCNYYQAPESLRTGLSDDEVRDVLASGQGLLWFRVTQESESGRDTLLDLFGFHPLAVDDCYNGRVDTPKIDDYGHYLFVVAQSVDDAGAGGSLGMTELDLFLGPNYVVTVSATREMPLVDRLFEEAQQNPYLMSRGADFLAHSILDVMVDQILPAVEDMDEQLDDLERQILETPDRRLLTQVLLLKRNALRLRRSVLPQRDMVNRLSRGEFESLVGRDSLIFFRDIYDHIVRLEELLETVRDVADSSLSSYLSSVNNRMNEIMKALSVVAVIFLPLTLIASIFGTNLDYSPFGWTFEAGFFLMLGFMVLTSGAMIFYFRRRGWF